jgi:DNA invertase Pin-like site-specific DNA recombinase
VLLSFAQFEREVTSERIRDKIAASKRKGLWVGGPLPLGYDMKDGKIAVVEDEAEQVRLIFKRYLELSGVNALVRDLKERKIRTKTRLLATGGTRRIECAIPKQHRPDLLVQAENRERLIKNWWSTSHRALR